MKKLKHCHFQICYNEYPFLVEKLPFLYKNFDQIIFYDLCVTKKPYLNSSDGSLEFLENFPDPDKKIIILKEKNIDEIRKDIGISVAGKKQMFVKGSEIVKDDIDVFWCTDADEFFTQEAFDTVDDFFSTNQTHNSFDFPHYVFFKDLEHIFCGKDLSQDTMTLGWGRIARHKKGNIYGHCTISSQYPPLKTENNLRYFHFAYVGEPRVKYKLTYLPNKKDFFEKCWNADLKKIPEDIVYGYDIGMHPNKDVKKGIKKIKSELPEYINKDRLMKNLNKE